MTLKELSRILQVSPSTISRVVNNKTKHCASPELRERILCAIAEYGYVPNPAAKRLKTGSGEADLPPKIDCLFTMSRRSSSDTFFQELAHHVTCELLRQGCQAGNFLSLDDPPGDHLPCGNGLVVLGKYQQAAQNYLHHYKKNIVCVSLNSWDKGFDEIVCYGQHLSRMALSHLVKLGHRKIAYIGEVKSEKRFLSYRKFMLERRLSTDSSYLFPCTHSKQGGKEATKSFAASGCDATAILCANDITACGVLEELHRQQIAVPQSISVISIDNIELAGCTTPQLTTVEVPVPEMGRLAVKILLDRLQKGHKSALKVELPCRLVIRKSCCPPPAVLSSNAYGK